MQGKKDNVTFEGNPLTISGMLPKVGQVAPDFTVLANDLTSVSLAQHHGKVLVICAVPSLDTPVCDAETRRFNTAASALGEQVEIWTVSMDLPFAQQRWCGAAGVDRVQTLSDHRDASFGIAYGILIQELRLLARAIFIIDANGTIAYQELIHEMTDEPNYEATLKAVRQLL